MTDVTPVGELIAAGEAELTTGPFGTQLKAAEYVATGAPVINVRNIGFGGIRDADIEYLNDETVQRLSRHVLQPGDIVFGRKGAVERHAFIQKEQAGWIQGSDCLRLRLSGSRYNARFVSYFLLTDRHKQWIANQCAHGATMASLNQDVLSRIELPNLGLHTQRKVAAILSAYDDLIENNHRRITALEEMGHRIYREWFGEFRYPGHEEARLAHSDGGGPPDSWQACQLQDLAIVNARTVRSLAEFDSIEYIDISSVRRGWVADRKRLRSTDAPGRARRLVRDGDVIWSTVRPNLRAYALLIDPSPDCVVSTGFAVLSPKRVPMSYLYAMSMDDRFAEYLVNHATGSAYPAVTGHIFEAMPCVLPSEDALRAFAELADPLFRLAAQLRSTIDRLRIARDLLLPRLVSGEIDVDSLDITVPDAA